MSRFSRRMFMRGAGAAALALPFLPSARHRAFAHGAAAPPRRVVFCYLPQSEVPGFMPSGSGRQFSMAGTYLEPLAGLAAKTIVIKNMKDFRGHEGGHTGCLTGKPVRDFLNTFVAEGGPSLDVYLGGRLGNTTAVPCLPLTLAQESSNSYGTICYTPSGQPSPMINDPRQAFELVYGPIGGTPVPPDSPAEIRRRMLQTSLLDATIDDYARLTQELSAPDRRVLDAHLTALRELEMRLQSPSPMTCSQAGATPPPERCASWTCGEETPWNEVIDQFIDVVVGSFLCDATRVAVLGFGHSGESMATPWDGIDADFHQIAHSGDWDLHGRIRKWQAGRIAHLCQRLDAIVESDGSTMLDNTVIAWLPELGYDTTGAGSHSRDELPAVLVGGCGGFFDTGQFIDAGGDHYHNLLLTFAHAMGFADLATWGTDGNTPMAALRA